MYEGQYSFDEIAEALSKVRKQIGDGKPIIWTGPDKLHSSIAASNPSPSWYFSKEGLEYMAERDHDVWEVYTLVDFHLGFHNAMVQADYENRHAFR